MILIGGVCALFMHLTSDKVTENSLEGYTKDGYIVTPQHIDSQPYRNPDGSIFE